MEITTKFSTIEFSMITRERFEKNFPTTTDTLNVAVVNYDDPEISKNLITEKHQQAVSTISITEFLLSIRSQFNNEYVEYEFITLLMDPFLTNLYKIICEAENLGGTITINKKYDLAYVFINKILYLEIDTFLDMFWSYSAHVINVLEKNSSDKSHVRKVCEKTLEKIKQNFNTIKTQTHNSFLSRN